MGIVALAAGALMLMLAILSVGAFAFWIASRQGHRHPQFDGDNKNKPITLQEKKADKVQITLTYWNRMKNIADQKDTKNEIDAGEALVLFNPAPLAELLKQRIFAFDSVPTDGVDQDAIVSWRKRVLYLKSFVVLLEEADRAKRNNNILPLQRLRDEIANMATRPDAIDRDQEQMRVLLVKKYRVSFPPIHADAVVEGDVAAPVATQIASSLGYVCLRDVKVHDKTGIRRHLTQIGCVLATGPHGPLAVLPAFNLKPEVAKTIVIARLNSKTFPLSANSLYCKFRNEHMDLIDAGLATYSKLEKGGATQVVMECSSPEKLVAMEIGPGKFGDIHGLVGHSDTVNALTFSSDGRFILSADDKTIRYWGVATGKEVLRFAHNVKMINCIAISPLSNLATVGSGGYEILPGAKFVSRAEDPIRLFDLETGKELQRLHGHTAPVRSVAFSTDGRFALSGGGETPFDPRLKKQIPFDCTIRVWDIAAAKEISRFEGHTSIVDSATFSTDGRTVLSGDGTQTIRAWNVKRQKELKQIRPEVIPLLGRSRSIVVCPPDTRTVSIVDVSGATFSVRQWNPDSDKLTRTANGATKRVIDGVAFSGNGRRIGVITNDTFAGFSTHFLTVFDARTGRELFSEESGQGRQNRATSIAISQNGQCVAVGLQDGRIRVILIPGE